MINELLYILFCIPSVLETLFELADEGHYASIHHHYFDFNTKINIIEQSKDVFDKNIYCSLLFKNDRLHYVLLKTTIEIIVKIMDLDCKHR